MDAYEYNDLSISTIQHFGCVEEGRFKQQRLLGGKRYDVVRFALYRDQLAQVSAYLEKEQLQVGPTEGRRGLGPYKPGAR